MPDIRCSQCGRIIKVQGLAATCPNCGNLVTIIGAPPSSGSTHNPPLRDSDAVTDLVPPPPAAEPSFHPLSQQPVLFVPAPIHHTSSWRVVLYAVMVFAGLLITVDW